jgi:hypothetical protein
VPDTTPTTPARCLFTTRQALDRELTVTGTWKGLHTAVHASTPRLTSHAHPGHGLEPVCGLRFTEDTPHTGQARTRSSVVVTADGHLTVRAYMIPGHRWLTALSHLGTLDPHAHHPTGQPATAPAEPAARSWLLRPRVRNRGFCGRLQPADHVQATSLTGLPDTVGDVNAMLTVTPDSRTACPAAWLLAVGFFHVLATGAPASPQP